MLRTIYKLPRKLNYLIKRNKTYLESHDWLSGEKIQKIGISNKAIEELGELIYVDYCVDKKQKLNMNEELVSIESIKAVNAINAPYDCEVININEDIMNNLDYLNNNPECEENSWFLELKKL